MKIKLSIHFSNLKSVSATADITNYGGYRSNKDVVYIPYLNFFKSILGYETTIAHSFVEVLACVLTNTRLNELVGGDSHIRRMVDKYAIDDADRHASILSSIDKFIQRRAKSFIDKYKQEGMDILIERNDVISHFVIMKNLMKKVLSDYRKLLLDLLDTKCLTFADTPYNLGSIMLNKLNNAHLDDMNLYPKGSLNDYNLKIDFIDTEKLLPRIVKSEKLRSDYSESHTDKMSEIIVNFIKTMDCEINKEVAFRIIKIKEDAEENKALNSTLRRVVYSLFASKYILKLLNVSGINKGRYEDISFERAEYLYAHICGIFKDYNPRYNDIGNFAKYDEHNNHRKVFNYIFDVERGSEARKKLLDIEFIANVSRELFLDSYAEITDEYMQEVKSLLDFNGGYDEWNSANEH